MKKINFFITTLILTFIIIPGFCLAQGNLDSALGHLKNTGDIAGTSDSGDVQTIVGKVINAALTMVGMIFLVLMVYAGYLWMTARGEADQVEKAKSIITAAIIGLVLVVSAYAISVFVTSRFE
jgi:cation transporter-like permease